MKVFQTFLITICCFLKFGRSQYYYGGTYDLPSITTSKEGLQIPNKDMMNLNSDEMMEEDNKLDFKSEVLWKIALAILAYKAVAFTLVLFALIVIIPLLNPDYFNYKR